MAHSIQLTDKLLGSKQRKRATRPNVGW